MTAVEKFLLPLIDKSKFNILPLAGDASSRKYSRVVCENESSWVLMEWKPFDPSKEFPFLSVLKYLEQNQIPVPKVIGCSPKQGYFLLEDLGDLTLERKFWEFQNQDNIVPYYKECLNQLMKLHALVFKEKQSTPACTAFHQTFDTDKLLWEFNYTHKHLIETFWKLPLKIQEVKELQGMYLDISRRLASQPQVICHRDFHSRNVMIKKGKVTLIDFQDARLGPAVYDLVSLLWDSYVELRPEVQQDLILYYCKNFTYFSKVAGSQGDFMEALNLQIVQRCFKACGSFASFKNTRDDHRYLKYISRTMKQVIQALGEHSEYSGALNILKSHQDQWI